MGGQRLTWSVEPSTVRKRFEALLQRMVDEAEAYAAFAQASGNELLMFDAEGLLEWVNGQAALSMRQSVQDALESAPFAEEALLKLLRAVESPLDRIKRRNATDEAQRWSDLVDWLYQMPGSLRNLLELEGLRCRRGESHDVQRGRPGDRGKTLQLLSRASRVPIGGNKRSIRELDTAR